MIYGHGVAAAKTLGWAGQGGAGRDMAPHRGGSEAVGRRAERAGSLQRGGRGGGSVPAPHRSPWRWPYSPRRCCSPGHEEEKRKRFICVGS